MCRVLFMISNVGLMHDVISSKNNVFYVDN